MTRVLVHDRLILYEFPLPIFDQEPQATFIMTTTTFNDMNVIVDIILIDRYRWDITVMMMVVVMMMMMMGMIRRNRRGCMVYVLRQFVV
jgi:hypothetical protein